jgi:halocyanin-like protein
MTPDSNVPRRTVLKSVGGLALASTLAGCSGDGGSGDSDGDDNGGGGGTPTPPSEAESYLSETSNYDGFVDETGQSEVTVDVGVEANDGNFGFGPAAIRVDSGTTVVWEWTGEGGGHNVQAEEGASFQSETVTEAGHTFSHTFESSGVVTYFCLPHKSLGMKGAVVVV